MGIKNRCSGERGFSGEFADDQSFAGQGMNGMIETELRDGSIAGVEDDFFGEKKACLGTTGTVVNKDTMVGFQGPLRAFLPGNGTMGAGDFDIDFKGSLTRRSSDQKMPARDSFLSFSAQGEVRKIKGGPHSGNRLFQGGTVILDRANVGFEARRIGGQLGAHREDSSSESARNHGADPFRRKGPVDSEAGLFEVSRSGSVAESLGDYFLQLFHTESSGCRDRNDGSTFECRSLQIIGEDLGDEFKIIHKVGFRESNDKICNPEISQDLQVLLGLGHPGVIGRDDKDAQVKGTHSGDHVVHEVGVTRDIDHSDLKGVIGGLRHREGEMRKAQLDRHAAFLFLGEAIGIGPGESVNKGGLAVVNVTGGSDDKVAGHGGEILKDVGDAGLFEVEGSHFESDPGPWNDFVLPGKHGLCRMSDHFLPVGKADLIGTVTVNVKDFAGRGDSFAGHAGNFGQDRPRSKEGEQN